MGTPKPKKSLEPMFIDERFRFDRPSETLQQIKRVLSSGASVVLTRMDLSDAVGRDKFDALVCAVDVGGEYLQQMREAHGEFLSEMSGEHVLELGTNSLVSKRIVEALLAGCDVYLIPGLVNEAGGMVGTYTLCRLSF